MTAFAAITLDSVPYKPSSIDSQGVAKLFAEGSGGFETRSSVSLSVKLPKAGGSVARVTAKAVIPVINATTSLKEGDSIATAEFVLPKTAASADRAALLALLISFLGDASVTAAVEDLESIY